jgi:hypothetical protein
MDWRLTLYYTGLSNPAGCPGVSFDKVYTINQQSPIFGVRKFNLALFPPISASDNHYTIVLSNLHSDKNTL